MRITIQVADKVGKEAQRLAENEKKSVSSIVTQAIEFFVHEKKR
jgi:predicted transcriptional regulator